MNWTLLFYITLFSFGCKVDQSEQDSHKSGVANSKIFENDSIKNGLIKSFGPMGI